MRGEGLNEIYKRMWSNDGKVFCHLHFELENHYVFHAREMCPLQMYLVFVVQDPTLDSMRRNHHGFSTKLQVNEVQ